MKQVNFTHPGGFPLEQETLERLQTAYRYDLFEALKSHLGINPSYDYIIAAPTNGKEGWAVIHPKNEEGIKTKEGILYPIQTGTPTGFLQTIRTGTNLTYGNGESQTAYFDYEAQYISPTDYANRPESQITDALAVHYYDLNDPAFIVIKDIQTIEGIIETIKANINSIKTDINVINQTYLPLNGLKAMEGDLDLGSYKLSKLDIKESTTANVRVTDFRLGSALRRAIVNDSTNLTLNYGSDWQNTAIGGKVYLDNLSTSNSTGSLLVIDNANQVSKSNTLLQSLIDRIKTLEEKPATAVPKGMIALWGKPAPFPEGWEEFIPLKGRMPVGLDTNDSAFNTLLGFGGSKEKKLTKENIPPLDLKVPVSYSDNSGGKYTYINATDVNYELDKVYSGVVNSGNTTTAINILNPYRTVYFIEYTGNPSDKTKPTPPTNLEVTNIGSANVTLSWTAATDNIAVNTYLVSINNGLPFSVDNVLSYNVTGLSPATFYNFYVIAQDAAGNISDKSNIANATTAPVEPEKPLTPTYISAILENFRDITITWRTSENNVKYELWRRPSYSESYSLVTIDPILENFFYDVGDYYTTYYYKVRAMNISGVFSDFSTDATITTHQQNACFDVESLVTMSSGQSKKLKNIVIGDKLQGLTFPNEIDESEGDYMLWNGKLNEGTKAEVTVVDKRTSTQANYYEIKTADASIKVTGEHPLLVSEDGENVRYVCAKNVTKTMLLIDKTGKTKSIESILSKEEPLEVALLDVEDVDNYVISGIVVHNSKPADPK